jgi:hypothetical protein
MTVRAEPACPRHWHPSAPDVPIRRILHTARALFSDRQDALDHHVRGRIVTTETENQFAIMPDRNPFGD